MNYRWLAGIMAAVLFTSCGGSSDDDAPPTVVEGPLDYMALGASDAFGIGASPLENGYVYLIDDALEAERGEDVDLTNLGVPGALADDILNALEIGLALDVRPDLVTLWTGANDLTQGRSPEDFGADLDAILGLLGEETSALIFVGDLPDLTALPRFVEDPDDDVTLERVAAFNAVIEDLVARHEARLVRLSTLDVGDELTSDVDGFHPSDEGHAQIAELFLQVIRPAFGLPAPE
ncbi:GDSL-type esterase/lipase family protein [Desulfuromonas sp. TF]|uniref:SGNH/GDSL hydrolase family protein n=1 Tax=Desulfuromonas sp. TF TaxID=1232410 RepID=UPI000404A982|nr:GDSL-type esterase/lipase family protein [Desulfuromonas sp. TF]